MAANSHSLDLELSSSQYAYAADSASLSFTGDFTIECWVKLEQLPSTATTQFTLVAKFDAAGATGRSFEVNINSSNVGRILYSGDGTNATIIVSDAALVVAGDVGAWVHLAFSCDVSAKTGVIYKNGVAVATSYSSGSETSVFNSTAVTGIGCRSAVEGASLFFDGLIDEVRIWNDIRSADEIANNWKKDVTNQSGLVAYWKLNNGYLDETANNNDLTASGSPAFSTTVPFADYESDATTVTGGSFLFNMV